jgi:SET domain-containing protein
MEKKKLIDHITRDVYCRLGVSKVSGVGVIAIKNIPVGTDPFKNIGKEKQKIITLTQTDIKDAPSGVKKIIKDFFGSSKVKTLDVLYAGPNHIDISFYMNYSKKPNVSITKGNKDGYAGFVTNRKIKKGEELFINYDDYE